LKLLNDYQLNLQPRALGEIMV